MPGLIPVEPSVLVAAQRSRALSRNPDSSIAIFGEAHWDFPGEPVWSQGVKALSVKAERIVDRSHPQPRATVLKKGVDAVGRVWNRLEREMLAKTHRDEQVGQEEDKESTTAGCCVNLAAECHWTMLLPIGL
jgi:ligand-binding sensor domain-containing protein